MQSLALNPGHRFLINVSYYYCYHPKSRLLKLYLVFLILAPLQSSAHNITREILMKLNLIMSPSISLETH